MAGPFAVLAAVIGLAAAQPPRTCTPAWHVVAHAGVPPLSDVVALSPSDVWSVGGQEGGITRDIVETPVIADWDGRRVVTTHLGWAQSSLAAVSAASARDIWAVGDIGDAPLAMHFDGARWRRVRLPAIRGWLSDVAAVSGTEAWAVGGTHDRRTLVLRWDGRRWNTVDMRRAAPHGSDLRSVTAGGGSVWAVGELGLDNVTTFGFGLLALRHDARGWHHMSTPDLDDYIGDAVAYSPSAGVWASTSDYSGNGATFVHWSSPGRFEAVHDWPINPDVNAIAPVTASDVWAVGEIEFGASFHRPDNSLLVGHWDGKRWALLRTALDRVRNPGGGDTNQGLRGISVLGPDDIWAVGIGLLARYSC